MGVKNSSEFFGDVDYFAIAAVGRYLLTIGLCRGYPSGDGILHIGDGFLLGFALRDAAGQAGNLGDPTAVFMVGVENDLPHGLILADRGDQGSQMVPGRGCFESLGIR